MSRKRYFKNPAITFFITRVPPPIHHIPGVCPGKRSYAYYNINQIRCQRLAIPNFGRLAIPNFGRLQARTVPISSFFMFSHISIYLMIIIFYILTFYYFYDTIFVLKFLIRFNHSLLLLFTRIKEYPYDK